MNLRIGDGELRFRVSKDELEQLASGHSLKLDIPPLLTITIKTDATGTVPLRLSHENNRMTLIVREQSTRELLTSLPSREGLQAHQEQYLHTSLALLLEVDIRSQKRKRG